MKPIFFDTVDTLYNGAARVMPEAMRERPMFSAFSMAALGSFGLTKLVQYISRKVSEKTGTDFDRKYLPKIEKALQYGIPAVAVLYSAIDPEGAKAILEQHPVYTAGMIGAFAGGAVAAQHDLNKRKTLEDKL